MGSAQQTLSPHPHLPHLHHYRRRNLVMTSLPRAVVSQTAKSGWKDVPTCLAAQGQEPAG